MNAMEFSLLMSLAVFVGFAAIVGSLSRIGRSNVFRYLMLVYSLLICAGYLTQHFVYEEPPNFMGFPLMGVLCWGVIGLLQILHVRTNNQLRRLEEERRFYEGYKQKWHFPQE